MPKDRSKKLTKVDLRLMEAARLSKAAGPRILRVDMSAEAIDARLREVAELSKLCLRLEADGKAHRRAKAARGRRDPMPE